MASDEKDAAAPWEIQISELDQRFKALEQRCHALDFIQRGVEILEKSFDKVAAQTQTPLPAPKSEDEDVASSVEENSLHKPPSSEKTRFPLPSRAQRLVSSYDSHSGRRIDRSPTEPVEVTKPEESDLAFILRTYVESPGRIPDIEILNPNLRTLLRDTLQNSPFHTFNGDWVIIGAPYEEIIHNWDLLERESEKVFCTEKDNVARSDLKLLLDTIQLGSGDEKLDAYLKLRSSHQTKNIIEFQHLWTIFPPGTIVYGRPFLDEDELFIVQYNLNVWPHDAVKGGTSVWRMRCWTYDWNGETFNRKLLTLGINEFDGPKPISSLTYRPFTPAYIPKYHELAERLLKRGEQFRTYCLNQPGAQMFHYTGDATIFKRELGSRLREDNDGDWDIEDSYSKDIGEVKAGPTKHVDCRVMVDAKSYFQYSSDVAPLGNQVLSDDGGCECEACQQSTSLSDLYKFHYDKATGYEEWEPLQLQLCPPRVLGYMLKDKQWAQLKIDGIKEVPRNPVKAAYHSELHLADGNNTKDLLLKLVAKHGLDEEQQFVVDDIVATKGKGLVILLYGPPGVGKSSTAEIIANASHKPLFLISVADTGTKPKNVEENLRKIFDLATTWKAVLLIDEADVFLESRGNKLASNLERNALVSVFLRVLEYYQGILILTTNQIAQFDVALQSRIHIAVKYDRLNLTQTAQIFHGFLSQLQQKHGQVDNMEAIEREFAEDHAARGFDGRQIRNIVQSAMGLARADNVKLNKEHIKKMVRIVGGFKDDFRIHFDRYMNEQKGSNP